MATVPERVVEYLRGRPVPICDDCLTKALGLKQRQQSAAITATLALTSDFNRYDGSCTDCVGPSKRVICRV